MKKFFSMFCALAIILSVNAAPKALQAGKMSKEGFAKMQVEKATVKMAPAAKFVPSQAIKRAPAAKMDTYNVVIVECEGTYWGTDIQYIMDDASGQFEFAFDILLPEGQEDVTLGQTYTLDDMDAEYTWGGNPTTYEEFADFTAATFVKTVDPATGLVNITASATDADGNIYNIVYQEEPLPVATDTIDIVYTAAETELYDAISTRGMFQFSGANATSEAFVCLQGTQIAGTYAAEDFVLQYTGLYLYGATDTTIVDVLAGDAVITFANDTFTVDAYLLGEDAHCYHVMMAYYEEPFVPTGDTVEVVITEPMSYKYYASGKDWWFQGANNDYKVRIDVKGDSISPAGVYDTEDVLASYTDVTILADNTKLTTVELEAVVTDVNNRIDLEANMLCSDGNVYHVTMFYKVPEVLNYDTIVATNLEFEEITLWGFLLGYKAYASNENYEVSLSLDDQADGTYEASGSITNIATEVSSSIYSGSIVIATATDGSKTITGDVLCMNETQYTLNLSFVMPEPDREETITATGRLVNYVDEGVWQAFADNAAGDREIVMTMNATDIAGTYTAANMYGGKYYTYVMSVAGTDTTYYLALGVEATVTVANNVATIAGNMITRMYEGEEVVKFNFTMTCDMVEQKSGLQYDEENADFSENFASYTVNDQYLESNGVLIVDADNDNDATIDLLFFVSEGLTDGTYPVNASEQPGTVWACTGVDSDGYIDFGFAGYRDAQGRISQVWFMVEGTVTVQGGRITVHALNSYGRSIDAVLNNGTGIEEVKADDNNNAEKFMRNGNLIIRHNGVEYNAQGATL